jgi:hypothetical protein
MHAIAEIIRLSPVVFGLVSVVNNLLLVGGCVLVSLALFRVTLRRPPFPYLFSALLCFGVGVARPLCAQSENDWMMNVFSTLLLLLPFACMAIHFRRKGLWKAMLVVFGYTFVESVKYILLYLFFRFDNAAHDEPVEMTVELFVDAGFFLAALAFWLLYASKREITLTVSRGGSALFLLVVATVAVFMVSLGLLSGSYTGGNHAEFIFMLLNIPLVSASIAFGVALALRARSKSDIYRAQLDMQVKHYEFMAQMNDDLRMFRHDFPKKMRPLIAYLDENNTEEARAMAESYAGYVARTGERFRTGNYRLDTVLFCEQQTAERDDITINVPYGTVFPKDGIEPDDLYTIFPNALDNAIEACRKVEGKRVIDFMTTVTDDTVYVTIRNPVAGEVKFKGGEPQTDKADTRSHGYGFRSLKRAAAHYGEDNVKCSVKDGVFELRLVLKFADGQKTDSQKTEDRK